jgi:hypothetical protein
MMIGPDNHVGLVSEAHHDQRAIARTAGHLLGLTMPLADATSEVMDDLLLEPSGELDVPGSGAVPPRLALAVFPNPTRAGAEVRVHDAPPGARVELLDASGRRVATLSPAGAIRGAWTWSGTDDAGRAVPPGRYVVRVSARGEVRDAALVKLR